MIRIAIAVQSQGLGHFTEAKEVIRILATRLNIRPVCILLNEQTQPSSQKDPSSVKHIPKEFLECIKGLPVHYYKSTTFSRDPNTDKFQLKNTIIDHLSSIIPRQAKLSSLNRFLDEHRVNFLLNFYDLAMMNLIQARVNTEPALPIIKLINIATQFRFYLNPQSLITNAYPNLGEKHQKFAMRLPDDNQLTQAEPLNEIKALVSHKTVDAFNTLHNPTWDLLYRIPYYCTIALSTVPPSHLCNNLQFELNPIIHLPGNKRTVPLFLMPGLVQPDSLRAEIRPIEQLSKGHSHSNAIKSADLASFQSHGIRGGKTFTTRID